MTTNHILETKYKVQKQLAEEAGYNMRKYVENTHKAVREIEKEYGIKLKYAEPLGDRLDKTPRGPEGLRPEA
jgi:hypothetical protein